MSGDKWFKEVAFNNPNSDIQESIKNVDLQSANEESAFEEKFMDTVLSKSTILPAIAVTVAVIALWAFMTKCGKKGCCQKERTRVPEAQTKKSVKGERSETASNLDLENRSHFTNVNSDGSSNGTQKINVTKQSTSERVIKANQAEDLSVSNKFGRASVASSTN